MSWSLVQFGAHSPFTGDERRVVEEIYDAVGDADDPQAPELQATIRKHIQCIDTMGSVVAGYPSPLEEQRLGKQVRGVETLVDRLSRASPANFAFFVPTRAQLGRALDMAESNFYRLLRHVCRDCIPGDRRKELLDAATQRLRICLYTRLTEEVLSAIATDDKVARTVRERAVVALAHIWAHRLTYRVSEFFPILEATWEARQRITVTGGTLAGTQEVLELFAKGCDPGFIDIFASADPDPDEIEAFREFLFAASAEELDRIARDMADQGVTSVRLHDALNAADRDAVTVFYEFFRQRFYLAMARRVARTSGPRHTAEGYVMIHYLARTPQETPEIAEEGVAAKRE